MKIKQLIAIGESAFVALDYDGSLWYFYRITDITTGITEWTWSQLT